MATMIRRSWQTAVQRVRNFLVHQRKTWLPYGAILVVLTGIWFLWDGPEGQTHTIREKQSDQRSTSPVFSTADTKKKTDSPGTLVYGTAQSIRTKPLPDLFAPALPEQDAGAPEPTVSVPIIAPVPEKKTAHQAEKPQQALVWPTVHGSIRSGAKRLVIVSSPQGTRVCAAGDWFDSFYIAYVHEWAVGIQKDAETREFPL